jgi:peroxiredoxin
LRKCIPLGWILSTQTTDYQREAAERLHIPFELLSDHLFAFAEALRVPMFAVGDMRLIKRVTLIAKNGIIAKHFYPVFPPDRNIDDVLAWLHARQPSGRISGQCPRSQSC